MSVRKTGTRKSTAGKSSSRQKRSSSRSSGLFKRKKIKPKVKLDTDRVVKLCVIIVVFCSLLILGVLFIPDGQLENVKEKTPVTKEGRGETNRRKESNRETKRKRDRESESENQSKKTDEEKPVEIKPKDDKKDEKPQEKPAQEKPREEKPQEKPADEKPREEKPQEKQDEFSDIPAAVNGAQIVFVFDDGGQNLSHLDKFLKLPFPVTIAVLPGLKYSKESAAKIRASGKELILHQPMQAVNTAVNPGPGAIKPEMSDDEVISTLFRNIEEIGPVAGMNNHEGSAITADEHKMEVILKFASENGIYFLDSRTNKDTKVPYVSNALGFSYYERNGLFLDNEKTRANALTEIKKNIAKANKEGYVVMIGHVWSADFLPQLLQDLYPILKQKGYVLKTVSDCKGKK
ncbi:divergent polysaccharide deacetylase family protein [Treponema sp.]|uniref:divergent polysaccharide deacetylase family protein n=1 Tax=Treponema sp. TaxID=166 RepID=UPI00298EA0F5|nr:divergent polysaccharide deacetylase family protein [Treponema sp.]